MPNQHLHQNPRGVSMIEVVVVVGVIALLVGIVAPALSSARFTGRATLCQSNLRQMGFAAHAYANIYNAFPIATQSSNTGSGWKNIAWDWVTTGEELVSPGPLWQFTNNPGEVMQCPEYLGEINTPGDPYTGYNYSTYLGGEERFPPAPGQQNVFPGVKPSAVRRPSEIAMFGLGGWKQGTNKFMRSPKHNAHAPQKLSTSTWNSEVFVDSLLLPLNVLYSGGQAFRYRGMTFVTYVDAHVGIVHRPEKGEHATDALLNMFMDYPRNGFLSNDASAYDPLK